MPHVWMSHATRINEPRHLAEQAARDMRLKVCI